LSDCTRPYGDKDYYTRTKLLVTPSPAIDICRGKIVVATDYAEAPSQTE
jgi:hypothetical protein